MLRFAQHDKLKMANLTLLSLSFNKERDVCASRQGEVNPVWMLRFAQHDRPKVALRAVCHSERERGIQCVDASLRYASFSMTRAKMSFRTQ
jgi:hypothetical protein